MDPIKHAQDLYKKFGEALEQDKGYFDIATAKACALICIQEVIDCNPPNGDDYEKVKQELLKIKEHDRAK